MSEYNSPQDFYEEALPHYWECALWSDLAYGPGDDSEAIPADRLFDIDDVDGELRTELAGDLLDFISVNWNDVSQLSPEMVGHDFWLTRNGHGAGFWDRGLGELGRRLTEACRPYGEASLQLFYDPADL